MLRPWFLVFCSLCSCDPGRPLPDASGPDPDAGPTADAGADAGAADGGLGCLALDLAPYRSTSCFCGAACECYLDMPYGAGATWSEGGRALSQTLDLYLPRAHDGGLPLVLWAHPNGSTKAIGAGPVGTELGTPVLQEGWAFASVEFRHPAVNVGAPATDLAQALQHLRCQARRWAKPPW